MLVASSSYSSPWLGLSDFCLSFSSPKRQTLCVCRRHVETVGPTRWRHPVILGFFLADIVVSGKTCSQNTFRLRAQELVLKERKERYLSTPPPMPHPRDCHNLSAHKTEPSQFDHQLPPLLSSNIKHNVVFFRQWVNRFPLQVTPSQKSIPIRPSCDALF